MAHSNHPGGEKHHYIPKFYMKQWAGEDDGYVSEFSRPYHPKPNVPAPLKPLMKMRRVNPDATGYLRGLNTFASLRPELADFLEHQFFKQTDDHAAQVLNRLLRCDLEFDGLIRSRWSRFVMTLFHRTPEGLSFIRRRFEKNLPCFVDDIRHRYMELRTESDPEDIEGFLTQWGSAESDEVCLRVLLHVMDSERVGTLLNRMVWAVVTFDERHAPLLTSDRPIVFDYGIAHPQGRLMMPLSPRALFVAANERATIDKTDHDSKYSGLAQRINNRIARQAQNYVYAIDEKPSRFIDARLGERAKSFPWE